MNDAKMPLKDSLLGLVLCLVLTLGAYVIVTRGLLHGWQMTATVTAMAMTQLLAQLWYFLHIKGRSSGVRGVFLGLSALCVALLVFGSIWIMNNLNYNMMHSPETVQQIVKDELISK